MPYVGFLNVALVWLAVHQLGFLYADGSLQRAAGGSRWPWPGRAWRPCWR